MENIEINILLDEIANDIENLNIPTELDFQRVQTTILQSQIINSYKDKLLGYLNTTKINSFFDGKISFYDYLFKLYIQNSTENNGKIIVDIQAIKTNFSSFLNEIENGVTEVTIYFRIMNININNKIELNSDITLEKFLENVDLNEIFPIDKIFFRLTEVDKLHLNKHRVYAKYKFVQTLSKIDAILSKESLDLLEKNITNALIMSKTFPVPIFASHALVKSIVHDKVIILEMEKLSSDPINLSIEDIIKFKEGFDIINNSIEDPVLKRSISRFIVGKLETNRHVNVINKPNWDKLVDYVIAMETIFLSGTSTEQLSYKFRLYGTTLLSKILHLEKRNIFNALKELYNLRSKIVHGGDESEILTIANKIIKYMDIEENGQTHPSGKLYLISKNLEEWIFNIYKYLITLEESERPHLDSSKNLWEDWLWNLDKKTPYSNE